MQAQRALPRAALSGKAAPARISGMAYATGAASAVFQKGLLTENL